MTEVNRSAWVPYSASQMYALVNDVESYPKFLPWCSGSELLSQTQDTVQAKLQLQKGPLSYSFVTHNRLRKDKSIEINLQEGPFKELHGIWHFTDLPKSGCKVELELKFVLSSPVMTMMIGPYLDGAMTSLVDSFCQRADEIYGGKTVSAY